MDFLLPPILYRVYSSSSILFAFARDVRLIRRCRMDGWMMVSPNTDIHLRPDETDADVIV